MTHENPDGEQPGGLRESSGRGTLRCEDWDRLWEQHSPVGQMVVQTDCVIVDCNPTAARLLGRDPDELRGEHLVRFTSDESARVLEVHVKRTHDSRQPQTCELQFDRGDAPCLDAVVHSHCVHDEDSGEYCLMAFFDIREWKGAEPGKLLLEEQLRQSQRLEVLGRLAAGVTHDFNNLLTLITGYSRLLTDQLRDDSQLRRHAEKISKAGSQATELVSQLLAFSRKSQIQSAVININEVIVDFESMLRQIVGEEIGLEAVLDPDIANIRVNPSQFDQVVMNLATNARDAMPNGGTLTLETTDLYISSPQDYGLSSDRSGRYVKLSVSDTGMGMPESVMEHIFDPSYTTKDVGKGTGLGLATVFSVVSQYGGAIDVDSEPGRGTTFDLIFPAADESVDRESVPAGLAERSSGFETVLLVENNEEVRRFARTVLEDYGYRVEEVSGPQQAVDLVDRDDDISVVVTDVLEPATRNDEFLDALRDAAADVRVVQVCEYPLDDNEVDAAEMLPKPYTPEQLAATVRKALDQP